jgi:hypothetical protein
MAYNFLGLANDVATRLNEVQLTESTFATAVGVGQSNKEAVNSAIRHINQAHFHWPFNHNLEEEILSPGVSRYSLAENIKYVDFGTFRLKRDTDLNVGAGKGLSQMSYSEYLSTYIDQEYETDTTKGSAPRSVVRTPDFQYIVVPMPDKAYTIQYEQYMDPVELIEYTDIPTIPERFRHVIIDGAMYYAYMFRDNIEMAGMSQNKFENGIKQMRTILTNEYAYFRGA